MKKMIKTIIFLSLLLSTPYTSESEVGIFNDKKIEIKEDIINSYSVIEAENEKAPSTTKSVAEEVVKKPIVTKDLDATGDVVRLTYCTVYWPVKNQCYGDETITADGTRIDLDLLEKDKLRYIAVSQDLLKKGFSYGDTVLVNISSSKIFTDVYIIHDCMNKRYTNSVDILSTPNKKGGGLWKNATLQKLRKTKILRINSEEEGILVEN